LRADEIVIIVTLICREALSGAPAIETIDLLRMVCSDERDLLRRRRLLGPRAPLVVAGLIEVEESEFVGATSVARIAPWVSAQILDEPRKQGRPIAPDDRIEFHDFIVGLDGSDPFFENL
jgi:hypothetical protein